MAVEGLDGMGMGLVSAVLADFQNNKLPHTWMRIEPMAKRAHYKARAYWQLAQVS